MHIRSQLHDPMFKEESNFCESHVYKITNTFDRAMDPNIFFNSLDDIETY